MSSEDSRSSHLPQRSAQICCHTCLAGIAPSNYWTLSHFPVHSALWGTERRARSHSTDRKCLEDKVWQSSDHLMRRGLRTPDEEVGPGAQNNTRQVLSLLLLSPRLYSAGRRLSCPIPRSDDGAASPEAGCAVDNFNDSSERTHDLRCSSTFLESETPGTPFWLRVHNKDIRFKCVATRALPRG